MTTIKRRRPRPGFPPAARTTDPETSKISETMLEPYRFSCTQQIVVFLADHDRPTGWISYELEEKLGRVANGGKRLADAKAKGWVDLARDLARDEPLTRLSGYGRPQEVHRISELGRAAVEEWSRDST